MARIEAIKNKYKNEGVWAATKEVPMQGLDLVKKNPWKAGGIVGALAVAGAGALTAYYYKCPDSKYATFVNKLGEAIATSCGKSAEWIKANPTITILAACLVIALVVVGALAYMNHDKANNIEKAGVLLNGEKPESKIDELKKVLGFAPAQSV